MNDTLSLYFLRHGLAGPGYDDDLRPLTAEGRRRIEKTAQRLAALKTPCDAILTSPLLRAVQTAEIVANVLMLEDRVLVDERLRCGCFLSDLSAVLTDHAATGRDLMLVGHQPDFGLLIEALTGDVVVMKPGTLALVDLPDSGRGRLVWLLQPEMVPGITA